MKKLTYVLFALLAVPLVAQAATTDAEELGRCIYNNTSSADRDTLVQFMYVSLGSTNVARKVQSIPQTKINQVNSKTKALASKLVLGPCRKQAARVLLSDPRNGMQQALSYTVERLVADRIAESTSGWLSSLGGGSSENASKVRNAIEFGSALMDVFRK